MARYTGGWIKVYRKLLDSDIADNPIRFSLFVRLMGMANLQSTWVEWGNEPRLCPRGALVTSIRELSEKVKADKSSIERQLKYLALRDTVVVESETRGTFITIKNFEAYQDNIILTGTDDGQDRDTEADTLADIPPDTVADSNEELINKELRTKNNTSPVVQKSTPVVSARQTVYISSFQQFESILTEKVRTNLAVLYPDFEFIQREFLKMDNWLEQNPKKNNRTRRGWNQFVANWFDTAWKRHIASQPSNKADQSKVITSEVQERINKLFGGVPHAS